MKGVRIHAIVRELNNENIDVINYSDEPLVMITRALAPAKLKKIDLDLAAKKATILVADDQVSLAIGKGGQNIRLAGKLSGFDLQLVKEGAEYDIELIEFRDEIGKEIYDKFIENGYDTAQQVMEADVEDLVGELGLEEEKVKEIVALIKKEFEEAEVDEDDDEEGNKKAVAVKAPAAGGDQKEEAVADTASESPKEEKAETP
jgi:N utilization substance protein A